jgi:hypothetical protein
MSGEGPYREGAAAVPRFVCIVCYRRLASHPTVCRTCHVEMLDLSDPAVREQVRLEAEKRLQRRMYREWSAVGVASFALAVPAAYFVGMAGLFLGAAIMPVVARGYARVRKNSAMATYAARRQRLSAELGTNVALPEVREDLFGRKHPSGMQVPDEAIAQLVDLDPEHLEMEKLLAWLGARLDS